MNLPKTASPCFRIFLIPFAGRRADDPLSGQGIHRRGPILPGPPRVDPIGWDGLLGPQARPKITPLGHFGL